MRLATWLSYFHPDGYTRTFPYHAQSPTLYKRVEYTCINDLIDEVDRIIQEPQTKKYGIGQSLYYQTILFCNPYTLIFEWCWEMLEDYNACKKYNIPLAKSIDEAPAWKLDCFDIIENEIMLCNKHKQKEDGSR